MKEYEDGTDETDFWLGCISWGDGCLVVCWDYFPKQDVSMDETFYFCEKFSLLKVVEHVVRGLG